MNLRETGRSIEGYLPSIDMSTTKFSESARKSSQRAGRGLKPATTCPLSHRDQEVTAVPAMR